MNSVHVFVDGELYIGDVIYNTYKGVGWPGGRVSGILLEKKKASRYQEVYILDMGFDSWKLRRCEFDPNGSDLKTQLKADKTYWNVIDMPGDNA